MKQIQDRDEIGGKTISGFYMDSDQLWLGFSDNTFAIFGIEHGYYDSTSLELITKAPTLLENTQAVLKLGVASVEHLAELEKERRAAFLAENEKRDREQFERLARKYSKCPL